MFDNFNKFMGKWKVCLMASTNLWSNGIYVRWLQQICGNIENIYEDFNKFV